MATKKTGSSNKGPGGRKQTPGGHSRVSKKARKPVTIDLEAAKVVSKPAAKPSPQSSGKAGEKNAPAQATKTTKTGAVPTIKAAAAKPATSAEQAAAKSNNVKPDASKTATSSATKPEIKSGSSAAKPAASDKKVPPANNPAGKPSDKPAGKPTAKPAGNGKQGSSSFAGKLSAGIVGGAVALTGAYLLQQTGIIPTGTSDNANVKSEISRIDEALKTLASSKGETTAPEIAPLIKRIAELEASKTALSEKLENQAKEIEKAKATASSLAASVKQAAETSASLQQSISSGSAGENAALSTLDERLKTLEASIAKAGTDTSAGDIEAIKAQLGELAAKVAQIKPADTSEQENLTKEISTSIATLSAKVGELAQSADSLQKNTGEKFTQVEGSIDQVQQKLTGLGERLDNVEKIAATPQKDEQRVARALAVAGLKSAIDSGGNFEAALALVESLSPDVEAIAALKPFAATGVPGVSTLENSFKNLADKIIAAEKPAEDTSAINKLFANMRSLVKIKATGAIAGNTPLAIVSRIEDGLKKSDLTAVIKEWELLPDAAKAVSDSWVKSVAARQKANELVDNLLNEFITGASGAGN